MAEGPNLVEAALAAGLVVELYATEAAAERHQALFGDASLSLITDRAAKALSDTVTPSGLIAVCELPEVTLAEVLADTPQLVAVAVDISEPGNAGTLIRIADAMGATAVVLAGHSVDPYNGKCLRASTGSIFSIPVVIAEDAIGALTALREAGLAVLATTVDGEVTLDGVEPQLAAPTAWLFGPEAHGMPVELAAMADHRVRIEMPGNAESLNVAAAAAICLYQSARASR